MNLDPLGKGWSSLPHCSEFHATFIICGQRLHFFSHFLSLINFRGWFGYILHSCFRPDLPLSNLEIGPAIILNLFLFYQALCVGPVKIYR